MCLGVENSLGRRCAVLILARRGNERTTAKDWGGVAALCEADRHDGGTIDLYNKSSSFKAGLA